MAPRETPKVTPKIQRTIGKNLRSKASPITNTTIKKTISGKKMIEKTPLKVNSSTIEKSKINPTSTPKPKENNSVPLPDTVTKSAKKATWKRRPKPAHSGVPVPEKMKKLLEKQLLISDCSF